MEDLVPQSLHILSRNFSSLGHRLHKVTLDHIKPLLGDLLLLLAFLHKLVPDLRGLALSAQFGVFDADQVQQFFYVAVCLLRGANITNERVRVYVGSEILEMICWPADAAKYVREVALSSRKLNTESLHMLLVYLLVSLRLRME